MQRHEISASLAATLYTAESAIDLALTETARFAAALPEARKGMMLSAVTGQKAFDGAAASITALSEARARLVETHNTMAAVARRIGLEASDFGPWDKPPETPPRRTGVNHEFADKVNNSL